MLGKVGLVAAGGAAGALARHGLNLASPWSGPSAWPWATFVVNLTGALAIGLLLGAVGDGQRSEPLRLAAGTGFLGGFTTYSAFALETVLMADAVHPLRALAYVALSVVGGLFVAGLGAAAARRLAGGRRPPASERSDR
jgi:CrcB protein